MADADDVSLEGAVVAVALRSIQYTGESAAGERTIAFTANDGEATSAAALRALLIVPFAEE